MKKKTLFMLLFILSLLSFSLNTFHVNATNSFSIDFEINQVDHVVQIQDGGLVIIKDTLIVSPVGENARSQKFPIGFPFEYAPHLVHCFAHNASNPAEQLEVIRDAGLGRIGFYGINVTLPTNMAYEDSYSFTVVFVFSGLIRPEAPQQIPEDPEPFWWWNATFPIYPSLAQIASISNVKVILPPDVGETKVEEHSNLVEKGLDVSTTFVDSRQAMQFSKTLLESFASESAWLRFWQSDPSEPFLMIEANELKRDIRLDEWGRITLTDFYRLTNKGEWNLTSIKLRLPQHASDVSWIDEADDMLRKPLIEGNATTTHINATIPFGTALERNEETIFTVIYKLPWKEYVTQKSWRDFDLVFSFFEREYFDWAIKTLSVTINLPRNAGFQSSSVPPWSAGESVTFSFYNVTPFHDMDFHLNYEYVIFWASFYPTLWVGLSVTIMCIIALLWRAPKPAPVTIIPIASETLRSFVETYKRKINAMREVEILEQQVQKRKISRRRYKVRKKALEGRLSVFSKDLTKLKEEIRKASSRCASAMRQIEVAETELEETEAAMRRIELRYRRREVSKGTYRKLMDEYIRRKERAETTIEGVLLRLQEEIR